MKLNKKGFTLIELLAVVVILLAISVIAVSSISAAIERNKAKQIETKQQIIVSYAKLYYEENKNRLQTSRSIEIRDLKSAGYLTEEEAKDADGNDISGIVCHDNGQNFRFDEDGSC